VSTVDVRSNLSHRQPAGGSITAENVNIVADEANGTGSGAIAVFAFALELDANQISPFFMRTFFHRRVDKMRPAETLLIRRSFGAIDT